MLSRFVFTCISSLMFCGEETLDELHSSIVDDAEDMFTNGVKAAPS